MIASLKTHLFEGNDEVFSIPPVSFDELSEDEGYFVLWDEGERVKIAPLQGVTTVPTSFFQVRLLKESQVADFQEREHGLMLSHPLSPGTPGPDSIFSVTHTPGKQDVFEFHALTAKDIEEILNTWRRGLEKNGHICTRSLLGIV